MERETTTITSHELRADTLVMRSVKVQQSTDIGGGSGAGGGMAESRRVDPDDLGVEGGDLVGDAFINGGEERAEVNLESAQARVEAATTQAKTILSRRRG